MSKKFEQEDPFTKKTREEKKKLFKYNISNSLEDKSTPKNTTVQQKVLSQPPVVSRNGFSQMIEDKRIYFQDDISAKKSGNEMNYAQHQINIEPIVTKSDGQMTDQNNQNAKAKKDPIIINVDLAAELTFIKE